MCHKPMMVIKIIHYFDRLNPDSWSWSVMSNTWSFLLIFQHIEKVLKAKQLELQLCEAKLQQQNLIVQEEMENHLKEKHNVSTFAH